MRTYNEASNYSKLHPDELVEFRNLHSDNRTISTGSFLNGEREGIFEYYRDNVIDFRDTYNSKTSHAERIYFWPDGSVAGHHFTRNNIRHGEVFNSSLKMHHFVVDNNRMKELDYLINEPRDDAFYVTLALYDIDKEYTLG